ncbi:hypothetical protein ACTFJT_07975, partial [Klebsiella quasipneumoniae]
MYHLDNTSGVPEMPEPKDAQSISPRWFGESQEQGGISWPGADWFNVVQAELLNLLQAAGIQPDKKSYDQLSKAIPVLGEKQIRRDLGSPELGLGAYIPAWQRQWALELINNVATYLNAGKINLWEYRYLAIDTIVNGVETIDWTLALTQALVDGAKYKRQVYAPGGRYYFQKMPEFVNLDTSGTTTSMSMYSLVGDGHDKTIFWT